MSNSIKATIIIAVALILSAYLLSTWKPLEGGSVTFLTYLSDVKAIQMTNEGIE